MIESAFSSLVVTLREGVEAALIVGIMWLYLAKTKRKQMIPAVIWGLVGGIVASLGLAWGLQSLDWSSAILEGSMMLVAAFFVGTLVAWMMYTAETIGDDIKERVDELSQQNTGWKAFLGIIAFTLFMVAREGFETVVFLQAIWFGSEAPLANGIGASLGLILAIGFGVMFIRGSVNIDLGRFFKITSIFLLIFIFQLLFYGLHEFGEAGLMGWMPGMDFIHAVAAHNTLFILAIVALPLIIWLVPGSDAELSDAELRNRYVGGAVGALTMVVLGWGYVNSQIASAQSELPMLQKEQGAVEVLTTDLPAGEPKAYGVKLHGETYTVVFRKQGEQVTAAAGEVGSGGSFIVHDGKLAHYAGENFDPEDYQESELTYLSPVDYELEGNEIYIETEAIGHAE